MPVDSILVLVEYEDDLRADSDVVKPVGRTPETYIRHIRSCDRGNCRLEGTGNCRGL